MKTVIITNIIYITIGANLNLYNLAMELKREENYILSKLIFILHDLLTDLTTTDTGPERAGLERLLSLMLEHPLVVHRCYPEAVGVAKEEATATPIALNEGRGPEVFQAGAGAC